MIHILENKEIIAQRAADFFIEKAEEAIKNRNRFTVALTGGSSPEGLHKLLATKYKSTIDWNKVYVFWGDERWVPLDNEKSNAGNAISKFLNYIDIPKKNIFPMWKSDTTPEAYANEYEQILDKQLEKGTIFDLIILGMGSDGHTASLFPNEAVLKEEKKKVTAYYLAAQDMHRITLTARLINQAKNILFIVYGSQKAHALYEVIQGKANNELYPSQLIRKDEKTVTWLVDQEASHKLSIEST